MDEQLAEDRLVYDLPGSQGRCLVQRLWICQQIQDGRQHFVTAVNRTVSLGETLLDAGSLLPDTAHLGGQLLFRPVRMTDQVKVAVLLNIECGELLAELISQLGGSRRGTHSGGIEPGLHPVTEGLGQLHGGVVGFDQSFELVDMQVGEVTGAALPSAAEVVEVLLAAFAPTRYDDQPMAAASTPQQALEVVVVGALAGSSPALVEQHPLYPVE